MFEFASIWDVYEVKFIFLGISIAVAIWLGNKITNHKNKDDK